MSPKKPVKMRSIPPTPFLAKLRKLSVERCEEHFFPLDAWSVLEWAGAAAGEAGETANVAKKMHRADTVSFVQGKSYKKADMDHLRASLADEIADTIIYLDLLAASQGIDLEEAIRSKFNQVSKKHGYDKTL